MGIPLVRGRDFSRFDRKDSSHVVIVNETLARRFWPGQEAVGQVLRDIFGSGGQHWEVVGVAADSKYSSITDEGVPFLYMPLWQTFRKDFSLFVRAAGAPRDLVTPVRELIGEMDPGVAVLEPRVMSAQVGRAFALPRAGAMLLGGFGLLSLALAVVGIYGVIAYAVSRRTREVGIRIALGAKRGDVLRIVLQDAFRLTAIGLGIGLVVSLGLSRFLAGLLFGVSPTDAITFLGVSVLLTGAALLASYIPAMRAARINPNIALRYE
jgi:putative ABC transport system permease protein